MELGKLDILTKPEASQTNSSPTSSTIQFTEATLGDGTTPAFHSTDNFDPFSCDASELLLRLADESSRIFSEQVAVSIIDSQRNDHDSAFMNFNKRADVATHVKSTVPSLRIISIHRENSLSALLIPKDLMMEVLKIHNIGSSFLDLLLAFHASDNLSEKSNSLWCASSSRDDGTEICYVLRYMEKKDVSHTSKTSHWTERQIGVYHRFGGNREAIMILLNTKKSTRAQVRLEQIMSNANQYTKVISDPLLLHILIFSSYLDNWRSYLQQIADSLMEKENKFLTTSLKDPSFDFDALQNLRHEESKSIVASSILQATLTVVAAISKCARSLSTNPPPDRSLKTAGDSNEEQHSDAIRSLNRFQHKCESYTRSACLMKSRISIMIGLLSDGINQRGQTTANKIADSSYVLTQKSVDDNYIVQVVTVVTAVYLPMQGVATFFGMNLTGLPDQTNKLRFAKNWWLFLATSIPLTLVTLGGLWIAWRFEKRRKSRHQKLRPSA